MDVKSTVLYSQRVREWTGFYSGISDTRFDDLKRGSSSRGQDSNCSKFTGLAINDSSTTDECGATCFSSTGNSGRGCFANKLTLYRRLDGPRVTFQLGRAQEYFKNFHIYADTECWRPFQQVQQSEILKQKPLNWLFAEPVSVNDWKDFLKV